MNRSKSIFSLVLAVVMMFSLSFGTCATAAEVNDPFSMDNGLKDYKIHDVVTQGDTIYFLGSEPATGKDGVYAVDINTHKLLACYRVGNEIFDDMSIQAMHVQPNGDLWFKLYTNSMAHYDELGYTSALVSQDTLFNTGEKISSYAMVWHCG